mgnify:FL=1
MLLENIQYEKILLRKILVLSASVQKDDAVELIVVRERKKRGIMYVAFFIIVFIKGCLLKNARREPVAGSVCAALG